MEDLKHQGERITKPGELFKILTENFREWFHAHPSYLDDDSCLRDRQLFESMTASQNIPSTQSDLLWAAITSSPATSDTTIAFQREATRTPTYYEYKNEVKWASTDSAGGMSELTYAMIKSWPEHIHKSIYDGLCATWTQKEIPEAWKWRWLQPIPKAPDPTVTQLRPLCLLEVLRKLWSKIFVKRIANYVDQHQILHRGQHSGKGKGTESAVLEFAATLETAKEFKSDLYISSWDIKRAYDSVQRRFLLFSWTRVGVPMELAVYLVSMDFDAHMVVQAPIAIATFQRWGYPGLTQCKMDFTPEQGTAQGGVDSSLIFAAFLDILLCAIQLGKQTSSQFYISDIDGNLQPTEPIAYVDDLICTTGSVQGIQEVADIVSAFCIVFHMSLNTLKFRAYAINWGNSHTTSPTAITIHQTGWLPVLVPMQTDGTMEHLGVAWDMSIDNVLMFNDMETHVSKHLDYITKSTASLTIKLGVIQISLMAQLIYETKFSTWTLSQYEIIDKLFEKAYRTLSYNQNTFPTQLLYTETSDLGCGFPSYSTQVQEAKLKMYQRSTYGNNLRRQFIMNSLTGRIIRQHGYQPVRHGNYMLTLLDKSILPKDVRDSWWFTSLSEHMAKVDIQLCRQISSSMISHWSKPQASLLLTGNVKRIEQYIPGT